MTSYLTNYLPTYTKETLNQYDMFSEQPSGYTTDEHLTAKRNAHYAKLREKYTNEEIEYAYGMFKRELQPLCYFLTSKEEETMLGAWSNKSYSFKEKLLAQAKQKKDLEEKVHEMYINKSKEEDRLHDLENGKKFSAKSIIYDLDCKITGIDVLVIHLDKIIEQYESRFSCLPQILAKEEFDTIINLRKKKLEEKKQYEVEKLSVIEKVKEIDSEIQKCKDKIEEYNSFLQPLYKKLDMLIQN